MSMPSPGTAEYAQLLQETGGASANPGFNYAAHIAATRNTPAPQPAAAANPAQQPAQAPAPIILTNPPATMPGRGTAEYDQLLRETGGASANPGFNYAAHIAATRNTPAPQPAAAPNPAQQPAQAPAPIILTNPPATMPGRGTAEYDQLLRETGGASANPGFNYAAHIAATRNPTAIPAAAPAGKPQQPAGGAAPIILINPPATMPSVGSVEYDQLLRETGGASANPGFNYAAHIAATRNPAAASNNPTGIPQRTPGAPAPIILTKPPASMPTRGSVEYEQLLQETGGASANQGFNYAAHIAATRNSDGSAKTLDLQKIISKLPPAPPSAPAAAPAPVMPAVGTPEYEQLVSATGGAAAQPGFNYAAHVAATRSAPPTGQPGYTFLLTAPPAQKPTAGTTEYQQLLQETGGAAANAGFDYAAHIVATRGFTTNTSTGVEFIRISADRHAVKNLADNTITEISGAQHVVLADKVVDVAKDVKQVFDQVTGVETPDAKMFRLYNAAFDRLPDADGLQYWIKEFSGQAIDYKAVASSFLGSREFNQRYGANVSNEAFVNQLYVNILGRPADASGLNYWVEKLNKGLNSREDVLGGFAESTENIGLFTQMTGLG